jgi:hypothetical protein
MKHYEINNFFQEFYSLNEIDHSYNPYLRMSKETEKNKQQYQLNSIKKKLYKKKFLKILLFFYLIIYLINNLIFNFIASLFYKRNRNQSKKSEILIFSHFTKRSSLNFIDSFYGNLPTELTKARIKVGKFYSNQTRRRNNKFVKELEEEKAYIARKSLTLNEQISFYKSVYKSISYSIRNISNLDAQHEQLVIGAILTFANRSSMTNYHLIREFQRNLNGSKPKCVFLTFEGHIYENAAYILCRDAKTIKQIFMFQSSPWVPSQNGISTFLKYNQKKLSYIVQGPVYGNYLKKINPKIKCIVIGNQFPSSKVALFSKQYKNNLLLIPDGDKQNIKLHLNSISLIDSIFKKKNYITLHPDTNLGIFNKIRIYKLRKLGVLEKPLSNLTEKDLLNFRIIIYTSSSLAIKSLLVNSKRYYLNNSFSNLNPLSIHENFSSKMRRFESSYLTYSVGKKMSVEDFKSKPQYKLLIKSLKS